MTPFLFNLLVLLNKIKWWEIKKFKITLIYEDNELKSVTIKVSTKNGLKKLFQNILGKYWKKEAWVLQMEGDQIEFTETSIDLDFKYDYIKDVVKSNKPVSQ